MRVVVFGGAGYVGSVLVRELLSRRHQVVVYDTLFFGFEGLSQILDQIEFRNIDIRAVTGTDLVGADAIINLAGVSSDPTAEFKPALTWQMNVDGAIRLAQLAK